MDPRIEALKKSSRRIVALTAYSHPFGRLLDSCDLDFLLVGDSLGMVEHGRPDTTTVTMEEMVLHTKSVRNGVEHTLLVADLPYGAVGDPDTAFRNARRLMEAGADAVKLEGGTEVSPTLDFLVSSGIPVLGHIGMLPQRIREEGRYRIKGKTDEEAERLLADALALQSAGAFGVVLELVAPETARTIAEACEIPVIGIGSGDGCDGQILVTYDLIGLTPWFCPKFVTPLAKTAPIIQEAAKNFARSVREDRPPDPSQTS